MSIHYRSDMPVEQYALDEEPEGSVSGRYRAIVIERDLFEKIADYTRSQPTGPRAGRVYRKNMGWPPDMDDNWFVHLVIDDPREPGYKLHVPYSVELVHG